MVLLNYEKFIDEKIAEQVSRLPDVRLLQVCMDPLFKELMIKLYEYCEEINMIEQRMDVLAR